MEELEIRLYICRHWAEALAEAVSRIDPSLLESLSSTPERKKHLEAALMDLREALAEVGVGGSILWAETSMNYCNQLVDNNDKD